MKKVIVLLLMLITVGSLLIGCGKTEPANKEETNTPTTSESTGGKSKLKIALDTTYRPMEYLENNEISGFAKEIIEAICNEMGKSSELVSVPWDQIFDQLYAEKYDLIISSVTINDERKKAMLFSDPYYQSMAAILTRKDININSAKDLVGKKVGIQKDTTIYESVNHNIEGVEIVALNSASELLDSFYNKNIDVIVSDAPVVYDFVKQKNDPTYKVVEDAAFFGKDDFGIVARKSDTKLIENINEALSKIKQNGKYDEIYNKYFKLK